jgi:hypothetical protein
MDKNRKEQVRRRITSLSLEFRIAASLLFPQPVRVQFLAYKAGLVYEASI